MEEQRRDDMIRIAEAMNCDLPARIKRQILLFYFLLHISFSYGCIAGLQETCHASVYAKVVCSLGSLVKSTPLGLVVAPNTSPPQSTFRQLPLLSIDHG